MSKLKIKLLARKIELLRDHGNDPFTGEEKWTTNIPYNQMILELFLKVLEVSNEN